MMWKMTKLLIVAINIPIVAFILGLIVGFVSNL